MLSNKRTTFPLVALSVLTLAVVAAGWLVQRPKEIEKKEAATTPVVVEHPSDFEDLDFQKSIFTTTPTTTKNGITSLQTVQELQLQATTVTTHKIVVAIEKQTLAKYPDAENQIRGVVDNINNRMASAGMLRQYNIDHFAPVYDKTVSTSCKAVNTEGKNLPSEFCSHSTSYVFIAADETVGSNHAHTNATSVEWHGYNGLFSSQGTSVFGHEMGHILGLPDMYHISIDASNNQVNGQEYKPFTGYIMHNLTPGDFHPWDVRIVNREKITFPANGSTWLDYQPQDNVIMLSDPNNCQLSGVGVKIYTSDPSKATGGLIDTTTEYDGTTNSNGEFSFGGNPLGSDSFKALKAFLIEVSKNNQKEYFWMNLTDINTSYWNGNTQKATYPFTTTSISCAAEYNGLISNLVVTDSSNAGDWSLQTDLQSGSVQYGDRTYTLTNVPSSLAGSEWVRTANDSKTSNNNPLVSFKVNSAATVYVAHDDRISPKPSWMSGWVDSGMNLSNTDKETPVFSLYSKSFSTGQTVSLGSNGSGSDTNPSMYSVIVKEMQVTQSPTASPTKSPTMFPTATPASPFTFDNLVVYDTGNASDWSRQGYIQIGDKQYGDRTYTFVSMPSFLFGSDWIRTANDSKTSSKNPLVSFHLNYQSTVYIAHDDRVSPKPSWMSGWADSGFNIKNSDPESPTFSLYYKSFSAGQTVSLGPNGSGSDTGPSMYTVIVKEESVGPSPTSTPIPSGTTTPQPTNPVVTSTPRPTNTPTSGNLLSNLNVYDSGNASDWSSQKNLQNGNTQFGDRNYTFTFVPSTLAGSEWVRTANDSKTSSSNPLATFKVNAQATVYIAHDDRITSKPSWMNGWIDSGLNARNSDPESPVFSLYYKTFSAGQTVSVGPNGSGSNTNPSMYTIIVSQTLTTSYPGDMDGDGHVNIADYTILRSNFGNTSCGNVADITGDCMVNLFDYNLLLIDYGK